MRLTGKVGFVSGGARGIGAAIVKLFAQEGARVGFGDILEEDGRQLEAEIVHSGGDVFFMRLDVTRIVDWRQVVQATVSRYGQLDILVNNAGIIRKISEDAGRRRMTIDETSERVWDEILDVNAKGVFLGTKTVAPELRRNGGGSIINISSIAAMVGQTSSAAYASSKGAVRSFTKAMAIEFASDGIRVNSIHPGLTVTPMTQEDIGPDSSPSRIKKYPPLGSFGCPNDIAYGALYLASDEAGYVTGEELVIDGGALID